MADERQLINAKFSFPDEAEQAEIKERLDADFDRLFGGAKELSFAIKDGPTDEELKAWFDGATKENTDKPV